METTTHLESKTVPSENSLPVFEKDMCQNVNPSTMRNTHVMDFDLLVQLRLHRTLFWHVRGLNHELFGWLLRLSLGHN